MKQKLRLRVLLPTAVLALMGVGVGAFAFSGTPGGAPEQPTSIKRPAAAAPAGSTLAKWRKQANAICTLADRDARALGTPQTREQLVELLPQSLNLADRALADLRLVPVPKAERRRIQKMLGQFTRFVELERQALSALGTGNMEAFASLTGQAFRANDRGNKVARSLGAHRCADDGTDDTALARARKRHDVVVAVLYAPEGHVDALSIREARAGASEAGAGFVAINVYDPQEVAAVTVAYSLRATPSVLVYDGDEGAVNLFTTYVDRQTVAQAAETAEL